MPTIIRTRSVLDLHTEGVNADSGAWFHAADEDSQAFRRRVYIDRATYEDLGQPTTITISIEPGDTLN